MTKQRGFTLIELSIVLAIIGLLVGGGLMSFSQVAEKNRVTQTNQNMDQIESALVLFAIRNHRLPCPADGSFVTGNLGQEQATGGAGAGTVNGCAIINGRAVIPWITLGLSENYSLDGWGHRFSYMAANSGINPAIGSLVLGDSGTTAGCLYRNVTGGIQRNGPGATTCDGTVTVPAVNLANSYPAGTYLTMRNIVGTELTTQQPGGNDAGVTATNIGTAGGRAAYVLISHGHNGWYGYGQTGNLIVNGATVNPAETTNGTNNRNGIYIQDTMRDGNNLGVNYFDDIVRWRTPAFIIQACGTGACGNP